jgi:hypothetical protein
VNTIDDNGNNTGILYQIDAIEKQLNSLNKVVDTIDNTSILSHIATIKTELAVATEPSYPPGTIIQRVAGERINGYLFCNGSTYKTEAYTALFHVIGNTFGGVHDEFKVPNFKAAFLRGANSQTVNNVIYNSKIIGEPQQDSVQIPTITQGYNTVNYSVNYYIKY